MSNKVVAIFAIPLIALAWFAGVKTGERNAAGSGGMLAVDSRPGTPVATFDGASISLEELKAQIEEQAPIVRMRYTTPEGKRDFLERMVRMELLAREAQRRGYDKDPDVFRQHKRNMVAVFVQKEFEAAQQSQKIAEDEIAKFYEAHKSEFVKPERVRVAHLFVAAGEKRAERKAQAEKLLATAMAKDVSDFLGFHQLARDHSEDAESKQSGGDLRFLTRDELAQRAGAEVAEAAFGLKKTGELLGRIVETSEGFHILKLLGRENALDMSVDDARESIRSRIIFDKRSKNYQQFVEDIEKKAGLQIDTAKLNELQIETGGAPRVSPGAIPAAPKVRGGQAPAPTADANK